MRHHNQSYKSQSGASYIVLVLVVPTILSLIATSIQIVAFLVTKQAARSIFTQQAYFAAEGSMFETIRHLETDTSWPTSFPYQDTYLIDDTTITRQILETAEPGKYQIIIEADSKGAKRRLVATYQDQVSGPTKLDVMLVMDKSGSMGFGGAPINDAKQAAETFTNIIALENPESRIGLVSFDDGASLRVPLSELNDPPQLQNLIDQIRNIFPGGRTNASAAINQAYTHLDTEKRPDSIPVIIILSDGVTNKDFDNQCGVDCGDDCYGTGTGYGPNNGGTCCTEVAINEANEAKNELLFTGEERNYQIFSISLTSQYNTSSCGNIEQTKELGRQTLFRISSEPDSATLTTGTTYTYYKETANSAELDSIYAEIAQAISSPGFFEYFETDPQPDPTPGP